MREQRNTGRKGFFLIIKNVMQYCKGFECFVRIDVKYHKH